MKITFGFGRQLMATIDLVKIALNSTAKMSLNDRFQQLRQTQMRRQNNPNNKVIQNNNRIQLRQGSQKNRRLALQMANRPSVLAALRTRSNQNNQNIQKSQPIKQRLGIKRFNNQTININRNQNQKFRNQRLNPINRLNFNNNTLNRNRINNRNQNTIRTQNRSNNTQNIGVIVGIRRKGVKRNGFRKNQTLNKSAPNAVKTQTGFKPKRKVGQQIRNQNQNKIGVKKRFQLNRNFNQRNNSGKPNPKKRNVKPNREQLDNDLDAYMAGTKTFLDAELDAYMSQTN